MKQWSKKLLTLNRYGVFRTLKRPTALGLLGFCLGLNSAGYIHAANNNRIREESEIINKKMDELLEQLDRAPTGPLMAELIEQQRSPNQQRQYDFRQNRGLKMKDRPDFVWNHLKANWQCVWGANHLIGHVGDGVKWGCGLNWLAQQPQQECVIYSVGSHNDFSFEESVLQYLPHCKVFTFDPTVAVPMVPADIADRVEFRKWGLAGKDEGEYLMLSTMMSKLGHSHVDILKVDIEGWEYPAFFALDERGEWPSIGQLLIEIHKEAPELQLDYRGYVPPNGVDIQDPQAMLLSIIRLFEKHSLRMFHDEINYPECCSEFSFIQKDWSPLRRDYTP